MTAIAASLQAFFTQRLIQQRRASPHTIAAYRDTLRMLLVFTAARTGKPVSGLDIGDLDAAVDGVPGSSGTRTRQQHPHPQRPPRRDPLTVQLPRPAAS
jgi:hypothetical protein